MSVYWIIGNRVRTIEEFINHYEKLDKEIKEKVKNEVKQATEEALNRLRRYWSGELLHIKTGRMFHSLKMKFDEENIESIVYSDPTNFRYVGFYYPLTHEAIGRKYTIIKPKKANYLKIPPNPRKGYYHWTYAKQVKIPKRPAFHLTSQEIKKKFEMVKIRRIKKKLEEVLSGNS